MSATKWESIGDGEVFQTYRRPVPGGWLVLTRECERDCDSAATSRDGEVFPGGFAIAMTHAIVFVADVAHEWKP